MSDNFKAIIHKRDTIFNLNVESPKIVVYYNSNGCTLCRLRELIFWKSLIYEMQKMPADCDTSRVEFVFIFAAGDNQEQLRDALENYNFPLPVLLDVNLDFEKDNTLSKVEDKQCFLLSKDNKVEIVGLPIYIPKLWQLYKTRIAELNQ